MFERYTEKARRVIFFARYEASQFGSPYIETEHLLLGLLREDKALANRFLRSHAAVESIRKQIEGHTTIREKVSTSVDLPLSHECKRVLAYGAEEAERLNHKHIGTEHLLLGLLREEKCFAAEILHERGLRLSAIREELARSQSEKVASARPKESSLLAEFSRDLTQAAMDNTPDQLIGRGYDLDHARQFLANRGEAQAAFVQDLRGEALFLAQQAQQQVLGADVLVVQPLGLFRAIGQHALALVAEGQVHGSGNFLADGGVAFNLLPDRFDSGVRAQKTVGQCLVLAQQAQQQVLRFDERTSELAGLVAREKDHPSRLLRVSLKHM